MATINNNGVLTSAAFSPTQSQYTVTNAPGTNSTWATTATYKGFTGYCSSEPVGAKYYRVSPDARVRVSQYGQKVIWISECKFLINLDNKGNYSVNVVVDENNKLKIGLHIIVAYGVSIAAVAENLKDSVTYKLEEFLGMKVKCINIYVEGVRVLD